MKIIIEIINNTWVQVRVYGINGHYLGVLSPAKEESLPEIIRAANLAGWMVIIISL